MKSHCRKPTRQHSFEAINFCSQHVLWPSLMRAQRRAAAPHKHVHSVSLSRASNNDKSPTPAFVSMPPYCIWSHENTSPTPFAGNFLFFISPFFLQRLHYVRRRLIYAFNTKECAAEKKKKSKMRTKSSESVARFARSFDFEISRKMHIIRVVGIPSSGLNG